MDSAITNFLENKVSIELPLKYPEVYWITFTPKFPGLLVSDKPSCCTLNVFSCRQLKYAHCLVYLNTKK